VPTLVATVGASNANSFATRAEGDTFADARLDASAWTAASNDDKDRALIAATALLDVFEFIGYRVNDTQALAWPRKYAVRPDRPYESFDDDVYYATTEIPVRVKDATCRLALAFLAGGTTNLFALDGDAGIVSKTVGPLSKTFDVAKRSVGLARIDGVMDRLKPLLAAQSRGGASVPLERV
jgi:hypothetical protein